MAATMDVSSEGLAERIASLDLAAADLGADFDQAAMDAAAGEKDAGKRAAEINQKIERLSVDRRILSRALDRALASEAEAAAKAEAEHRQRHYEQARTDAAALVDLADRVDGLVDDLLSAVAGLTEAENAVRSSLIAAKRSPDNGLRGRRDLALMVQDRLAVAIAGRSYDKTERRAGHFARTGWRDLLEPANV